MLSISYYLSYKIDIESLKFLVIRNGLLLECLAGNCSSLLKFLRMFSLVLKMLENPSLLFSLCAPCSCNSSIDDNIAGLDNNRNLLEFTRRHIPFLAIYNPLESFDELNVFEQYHTGFFGHVVHE
jgi:hypothetical protein